MADSFIVFFDLEDKSSKIIGLDQIKKTLSERPGFCWLDWEHPDPNSLNQILIKLECPTHTWENYFNKPEVFPHLKDTPTSISFYLYDVLHSENHFDSAKGVSEIEHAPFLLILSERLVISYHQKPLDLIEYVKKDCNDNFRLAGKSPAFIVFLFIQHCLYNYARLNLANDNFLDLIEFSVLMGKKADYLSKISKAGFNILTLKKLNANLHIILLMMVTKRSYVVTEEAREAFHHMLKDTIGIREAIDSSRDLLDSIIASTHAEAARQTGQIVQVLTIVSTIFMPLTLIAGIYGMNFEFLPELHWKYGYFFALGLMVSITGGFLYLFKRMGWLWSKPKNGVAKNGRRRHPKDAIMNDENV